MLRYTALSHLHCPAAKLACCFGLIPADRAKLSIRALSSDVEATIARLEKKWKDMEKTSNSAVSKQKILKGLFERLQ